MRGSATGGVGGAAGSSPPPPLRPGHRSPSGRKRLWVGAAAATGPGARQRLASVPGARLLPVSSAGTERKLGSDGHKPDRGAGKISPLPHVLARRRAEPGKREQVGADAPRPPSWSLSMKAPERKVTGPLDVHRAGVFVSCLAWGQEGPLPDHGGPSVLAGVHVATLCFPAPYFFFNFLLHWARFCIHWKP